MRRLAAAASLAGGALLVLIPRFVFPACEYLGRGRMHCTDAARGEFAVGGLLVAVGVAQWLLRAPRVFVALAAGATLLCAAAFFLPAVTRYCANPDMACRYGMVPSVRFVAAAAGIVQVVALVGVARATSRRDA